MKQLILFCMLISLCSVSLNAIEKLSFISYDVNFNEINNVKRLDGECYDSSEQDVKYPTTNLPEEEFKKDWFNLTLFYYTGIERTLKAKFDNQNEFRSITPSFKPKFKTFFIIHGWKSKYIPGDWLDEFKDPILDIHDGNANVFIVDWYEYSKLNYLASARFTRVLGNQLAKFIVFLKKEFSIESNDVHCVGHSLGAHACGFTGKALIKQNITISKITGLDPAGPQFMTSESEFRLDHSDASFVEVLHTNMANSVTMGLGIALKIGHVDIFLNGGSRQKGCHSFIKSMDYDNFFTLQLAKFISFDQLNRQIDLGETKPKTGRWSQLFFCDHSKGVYFYQETIEKPQICQPVAYECDSYKNFLAGKCDSCGKKSEKCHLFGYNSFYKFNSIPGKSYFLLSNSNELLCANHYRIKIIIKSSNLKHGIFELKLRGENGVKKIELEGHWNKKVFSALFTTEKNFGQLIGATGKFKSSWLHSLRTVDILSMDIKYMSHINSSTRNSLSAKFDLVSYSKNDIYYFDRWIN